MSVKKTVFKVKGLDCPQEVQLLQKVLGDREGIQELNFQVLQAKMEVTHNPRKITEAKIMSLVAQTGLEATPLGQTRPEKGSFYSRNGRLILTFLSALFLLSGTLTHYFFHPSILDLFRGVSSEHALPFSTKMLYLLSIICGAWYVFPRALISLRTLRPDMNLLMIVAMVGAIAIEEWFEAATVAFLFSLALLLEQWSVGKARSAISALLDLSPQKGRVVDPATGEVQEVDVETIQVGALLLVKPGEKIPLDGVVKEGASFVNQSPITGESIQVSKEEGDEVYAGTLNENGALYITATKPSDQTVLARMTRLVEQARSKRSDVEQWIDTFSRYYTPLMFALAFLVSVLPPLLFGVGWDVWIYKGLVLLVIACPCALVISTPVSIVSGLTAAARKGVLIKGGVFLEIVSQLKAFAFDKTGTLTKGKPEVQRVVPLNGHTELQLLERAVALEKASEHPLAQAILSLGEKRGVKVAAASNFQIVKGKGALGTFEGKLFWIGSHRFMHEMGQETEEIHKQALALEDVGHSIVAIGNDDHVCGLISIADSPREEVKETISALKKLGIEEVVMLTGDNEPTAKSLAMFTGVDRFEAELLPEEKVEAVTKLASRWEKVAMVGDGVNDAPAMAAASIGFAMGGSTAAVAIETGDVTLMSDDLEKLPWLILHSRKVVRIIKQNIFFALSIKAVFISLAFVNLATLWLAIMADTGATMLVIFNGLRILHPGLKKDLIKKYLTLI